MSEMQAQHFDFPSVKFSALNREKKKTQAAGTACAQGLLRKRSFHAIVKPTRV
jgi:hypothetical protein